MLENEIELLWDETRQIREKIARTWNMVVTLVGSGPLRATMWHDESTVVTGNAISRVLDAAQLYATYSQQSVAANGDAFTNSFVLNAGSYTLYILGVTGANGGTIDWTIDDVAAISGQDWYSASTTRCVVKSGAVTVVGNGRHVLKGTVNGHHASSGGYYIPLTKMWLV